MEVNLNRIHFISSCSFFPKLYCEFCLYLKNQKYPSYVINIMKKDDKLRMCVRKT